MDGHNSGARQSTTTPQSAAVASYKYVPVEFGSDEVDRVVSTVPRGAANVQDIYPLTPLQEGILFHHALGERSDSYVLRILLEMESRSRLDDFVNALRFVISRHDALRTAIIWEDLPSPVQVVYREVSVSVEEIVLALDQDALEQGREQLRSERQPLDLRAAPLLRLAVAADPHGARWLAFLSFHHVIVDHESFAIMCAEMAAFLQGRAHELREPIPYRTHVIHTLERARVERAEAFFRQQLADVDEPTLPFGLLGVRDDGGQPEQAQEALDLALGQRLRACARRLRVSTAALFHAGWGLVASRTSGRDDVVFGTVLFGRMQTGGGAQRKVGLFLNSLPLRVQIRDRTAREMVEQAHRDLTQLLSHEQCSLAKAQRCSGVEGSIPLFNSLLNYRHTNAGSESHWAWGRLPGVRELAVVDGTSYPLTVSVDDSGERFCLTVQADRRIDPHRVAGYLHTAMRSLVDALESEPQRPARILSILPETERALVIESFNATQVMYPRGLLVHELFESQVERCPEAVAVVFENQALTYAQLNARANRLAHYLGERQVGPDKRVGICLERSLEMLVGLLGILKAGGAYVPLDPTHPAERLQYMLEDATPGVLLTQGRLKAALPNTPIEVLALDEHWGHIARYDATNVDRKRTGLEAHHLAYVIYTSGSTGRPKGAMNEHRAVVNRLQWMQDAYRLGAGDRVLQKTPVSFDVSVWEFFWTLLSGARLIVARPEGHKDPDYLREVIDRTGITTLHFVPSMLRGFLDELRPGECSSVRHIVCSGEELPGELQRRCLQSLPRAKLSNLYGPTEAAVDVTAWECRGEDADSKVPIGRPIANLRLYVLDRDQTAVPIGVTGEIHIGGIGVGRGYLNRAELTAERFVSDPYADRGCAKMYRTGDLGRWRADGVLEYLGRNDDQVKIRGFRIELGEIETRLLQYEHVREAVVVSQEDSSGEKRLVAYVVPTDTPATASRLSAGYLRAFMKTTLPEHMVPGAFVMLDRLPLSPNGKLNRRALPKPDVTAYDSRPHETPQGDIEKELADIWSEVLGVSGFGRHDDFFELGGHSLLGMRVIARLAQKLRVRPPVVTIFQYPTVSQMARLVETLLADELEPATSAAVPLGPRLPTEQIPLTFSQQWLWDTLSLKEHHSTRSVSAAVRVIGWLNTSRLKECLEELRGRHEALRTRIVVISDVPRQAIDPVGKCDLEVADLTGLPERARVAEAKRLAEQLVHQPLSLAQGPLFAATVLRLSDQDHVLVVAMDHMISDGASLGIFSRELWALYSQSARAPAEPLPASPIQFADYAVWEQRTHDGWMQRHGAYWAKRLHNARALQLTTCTPAQGAGKKLKRLPVSLGEDLTVALRGLSRVERTTPVMAALTAYVALLSRICAVQDLVVTFIAMGRLHSEVTGTIGYFNAPLFLRVEVSPNDRLVDLLRRISEEYAVAYQHSDSGRVAARTPRPEFVWNPRFNWIPADFSPRSSEPERYLPVQAAIELATSPFEIAPREDIEWGGEIELALSQTADGIGGALCYRADRFSCKLVEHLRHNFVSFCEALGKRPDARVSEVALEQCTDRSADKDFG